MISALHKSVKDALYSQNGAGEFATLLGSRIYDVVGDRGDQYPFAIWSFSDVQIVNHFDAVERVNASLDIRVFTDVTKGVESHLTILDALIALRGYTATGSSGLDRVSFVFQSIGEVNHDDEALGSSSRILVSGSRS